MIAQTEGIVLRITKYGDTSLICHVFTRTYGLKSYIVKGVRSAKKQSLKGNIFQPGNIIQFSFYHVPNKSLLLLKEAQLNIGHAGLREDIVKNCIQLFMIEVLSNVLEHDFPQEEVYDFVAETFDAMADADVYVALLPIYFLLHINQHYGYTILNNYSELSMYFNIWEGDFRLTMPEQPPFIDETASKVLSDLLLIKNVQALNTVNHHYKQHELLSALMVFMEHHYPNFKSLKSLPVLSAILNN